MVKNVVEFLENLPVVLVEEMQNREITWRELGDEIGVAHSNLYGFVFHGKNIGIDNVIKIARWLQY